MQVPPSVSGEAYPSATGAETRSNILRASVNVDTAYDDNVLGGGSTVPISDISYSIKPSIAFDQTTSRLHQTFAYNPAFTLYQRTSGRNEADQNVTASAQYRLSPHIAFSMRDNFRSSTNVFNLADAGISGSTQPQPATVVAPFADQRTNAASGEFSYQYSRIAMIGGGGTSTMLDYPNSAQTPGLFNSNSRGGSAFYNLRLSSAQSVGVTYQYSRTIASSNNGQSETQTSTLYSFYTLYLRPALSLSISGGPQHSVIAQPPLPSSASWNPALAASMSWQKSHTNFTASYARTRSGGGGLLGEFSSNSASANARWQVARTWTLGSTGSYSINKNVTPLSFASSSGGHSVSGSATVQRQISEHLTAEVGYARLHQSYSGISAISEDPDSDREYVSISYQFTRPVGR